jgi:mRNA-degrading endonuclease toxin of MazEF toxin-antitoxin module
VTQLATLDRSRLVEKIGTLSADRVAAVLEGLDLLLRGV